MRIGGLIGCGFFAGNHLNAWNEVTGAYIAALCDPDEAKLRAAGQAFGIDALYTDAREMLDQEKLDFVDIVTTAPSHRSLVELTAARGLDVTCQKPFAENLADARAMVAAASEAGKTLMVHENFRWQSAVRTVIERVRTGEIGTPFFCRASFRSGYDVFSGQPYLAEGTRFIIEDLGIHVLDIARAIMGDAVRVAATTARINQKIKGEDVATILITHSSGMTSVVDCSYATRRSPETFPETLLEIDGEAGTLRLDAGYRLTIQTEGGEEMVDVTPKLFAWAEKPWHNIQESVITIQQHFIDCLSAGQMPETSGADNLKTLELVEAAYVSAAEGRSVGTGTV
ncbi:MAG: Gfo/Idh/MocA family oxidoreductase [Paracoccaceae bacterium]